MKEFIDFCPLELISKVEIEKLKQDILSLEKNMVKKSLLRVKAFLNEKIKNQIKNKINKLISFKKIF